MGDLNACICNRDDFIINNHVVPLFRDYEEYLLDDIIDKRASRDKQINKRGIDLIQFCKTNMLQICNGRMDEDRSIGHFT